MAQPSARQLDGMLVTVFGGGGFLGRHLVQELLSRGARVRIVGRRPERAFSLKPLGILGQIQFMRCDVLRPEYLAAALEGAGAAVNLVGAFSGNLDGLQGEGAGRIAAAAKAAGASAFVHVSAIGADPDSPTAYGRTKGEGEAAVLAAFPDATILRPSIVFGPDDNFVNRFARLIASLPALPVFGATARVQPVFVDDVAEAIANVLCSPADHAGRTYELAGPEVITMLELNRRIAAAQHRSRPLFELPDAVCAAVAAATGWLPGAPITRDQWTLLRAGNVASGRYPGLRDVGVTPHPLGLFLEKWMVRFRKRGRFEDRLYTPQP